LSSFFFKKKKKKGKKEKKIVELKKLAGTPLCAIVIIYRCRPIHSTAGKFNMKREEKNKTRKKRKKKKKTEKTGDRCVENA
jgi:predicted transcriptional regulator